MLTNRHPSSRSRTIALCAAITAALCAAPEFAEGAAETPRALVDRAIAEYNLGHFIEATVLFEKAYQLDPAPILLFNIAQCHRHFGNNERALFFYQRFLEEAPASAPERPEVEERVTDLERSLREQSDLKDRPPPGVQRNPASAAVSPQPAPSVTAVSTPGSAPVPPPFEETSRPDSRHTRELLAWTTGAAAAAALVFGGVEAALWSDRAGRFDNHVGPTPADPTGASRNCGAGDPNRGGPGCASLYADLSSARTWTIVGFAAGGLLAAGSAVLFATSRPADKSHLSAACGPALGAARGAGCLVAF